MLRTLSSPLAALLAATAMAAGCSGVDAAPTGGIYRVEIEGCAGLSHQRATAMAVGPGLVATAAHTFEEARGAVLRDQSGQEHETKIVYLDLDRDIALLQVEATADSSFVLTAASDDLEVSIPTYADVDGIEVKEATVVRTVNATLDGEGERRALELIADIERGDSGAPVVDGDGQAVGMVFAASRRADRGWAVAAEEITEAMETLATGQVPTPASPCRSERRTDLDSDTDSR